MCAIIKTLINICSHVIHIQCMEISSSKISLAQTDIPLRLSILVDNYHTFNNASKHWSTPGHIEAEFQPEDYNTQVAQVYWYHTKIYRMECE